MIDIFMRQPLITIFRKMKNLVFIVFSFFSLISCTFLQKTNPLSFQWPLKKYKLSQKFIPFQKPPHLGIDLTAPIGTSVFSGHSGRIIYAGNKLTGYGNVVVLEHSSKWASLYAHLKKIKVKTGQKIKQGDIIGSLGNTGQTSGLHLHFELMYKKKPVNPLLYLP